MKRIHLEAPLTSQEKQHRYYLKHKEQELERNKDYCRRNKQKVNVRRRNYRHGITQDWFDSKLEKQNNCCAICGEVFNKTPHIDHDHNCCSPLQSCDKCRRDLLCEDCNLGIGRFKDSPELLQSAINYVQKWKTNRSDNA